MPNVRRAMAAAGFLLCALAGLVHGAASTTNDAFIVNQWDNKDGLPQSSVISMIQTRDGYLWLGTLNGLARFDGVHFKVFDEANTPGLNSSRIVRLFEDSHTNLWVATESAGVVFVQEGTTTLINIGQRTRESRVTSIGEDDNGAVWFYTADGQLYRCQGGQFNVGSLGADYPSSCRVVAAEKSGPLWVGTDAYLYQLKSGLMTNADQPPAVEQAHPMKVDFLLAGKNGGRWRLADGQVQFWRTNALERDLGPYPWRPDAPPTAACEDADGNLVVGTFGDGVYWFRPDGTAEHVANPDRLAHSVVTSLCVDHEGDLWVGTDGNGLYRVRRGNIFVTAPGTRDRVAKSVCADTNGGVWMGFNNGGAMYLKDGITQEFGVTNGLPNNNVWSVYETRSGRLLVGTYADVFLLDQGVFQPGPLRSAVLAIFQDRTGTLWFGTQNGLVSKNGGDWNIFTTTNGLTANTVQAIAEDAAGNIWAGTMGGGLNRLQGGQMIAFRKSQGRLSSDDISSLYEDGDGVLWVGTFDSGLARFADGKWSRYTRSDGLAGNGIGYLIEDGLGYLWIGSNQGLMRVLKKELNDFGDGKSRNFSCRTYTESDGLPTRECSQGSQPGACQTPDGRLWFTTSRGVVSVNPAEIKPNTNFPPVVIESVLVDGREQGRGGLRAALPTTITIPPHREELDIQFTSLNLGASDRAHFKYLMEGHETRPVTAGDSRMVRYPKLPPGQYQFKVTACNEDGIWNPHWATLGIIVEPPFWQTAWFIVGMFLLLLGSVIGTVHFVSTQTVMRRLKQQEALEKDRSRIARDLHDQLGASLTQVALLGEMVEGDKDQPGEVAAHGEQISQTARDTTRVLDEIVWAVNPQNDTLDSLITYVCKYAQDYLEVADLKYRLDVPPELPPAPLQPEVRHNVFLAAKEAITNVVKHAQATSVWLRLQVEPTRFTLEIQDDGRGAPDLDRPSTRNGLRNMRKRMEDVGGTFAIGPAPDRGTVVRLTAPMGKV